MQLLRETLPVALFSVFAAGCPSSSSTEIHLSDSLLRVSFKGLEENRTLDLESPSGSAIPEAVKIRFTDAAGQMTGSWAGFLPAGDLPVPMDAVRWHLTSTAPPPIGAGLNDSGVIVRRPLWYFAGGPVEPDPLGGTTRYVAGFRARSEAHAESLLQELLEKTSPGGTTRTLPEGIYRIHQLLHTHIDGNEVVFTFTGSTPFEGLEFDLNGTENHRNLDDAELSQQGAVHRATLRIPLLDFNQGGAGGTTHLNHYVVRMNNAGQAPVRTTGRWEFTAL
jgi:hypothetical protein